MRPRVRILMTALLTTLGAAMVAAACSSFTAEDDSGDNEGGAREASSDDTSVADAAADGDAGDARDATDPDAFPSTPLVQVLSGGRPFAIEATEVSVAQYNLFRAHAPKPLVFPKELCPQKTELGPPASMACVAILANTDPMTCVDWCDANAYCTAIGRHLCGDMADGGALAVGQRNNPGSDEWFYACRGPGAQVYPYGSVADAGACNTASNGTVAVGSRTACQGAESGLFDMSGNAAEWIASCVPGACSIRGGSYGYSALDSTCDLAATADPQKFRPDIGFRCCAEL